MNLKYQYWFWPKALTPRFCDDVMAYGNSIKKQKALTGVDRSQPPNEKELEHIETKRKSDIVWLNESWIYNEIHPYVHEANRQAGWNFQWDFSENFQFTEYKKGQFYDWHTDSSEVPFDCPNDPTRHGKIRKITIVSMLTDPEEYEGGELQFNFRATDPQYTEDKVETITDIGARGSIIVFPSFLWHRVKPVTKGIRHSLVLWNLGQPYV